MATNPMEFKQENWKTRSMKLGKGVGNGVVSGAVAAKNMTVSGAKGLKEKDWKKKEQPAAKPGPGARNAQVGQQQAAKAGGAGAVAKGAAVKTGTAVKNSSVSAFGSIQRGISGLLEKNKKGKPPYN